MRAVIQRVSKVKLSIENEIISEIKKGLLVFIAIEESDEKEDILWLSKKIASLRIFNDENGLLNKSSNDIECEIMVVSQFTLFASTKKGNRPSFIRAAKQDFAYNFYCEFISQLEIDSGKIIKTGKFAANMQIELINDGPVTIIIDSKNRE